MQVGRGMGLPKDIENLIERFDRNRETYRSGQDNEALLRQDFLNPFFEALGWDMANKAGYAEAYQDVIHEDALKIGGATKAPPFSSGAMPGPRNCRSASSPILKNSPFTTAA